MTLQWTHRSGIRQPAIVECPAEGCDGRRVEDAAERRDLDFYHYSDHLLDHHGPGDFGDPIWKLLLENRTQPIPGTLDRQPPIRQIGLGV